MDGQKFYEQVRNHPGLTWLGVKEGYTDLGDAVVVMEHTRGLKHAVAISAIRDHAWADLEAVLTNERPAQILRSYSRIVGYFSRIANWNGSKHAELAGRQGGDYVFPEPKRKKVMVPGTVGRKSTGAGERIRTSTPVAGSVV